MGKYVSWLKWPGRPVSVFTLLLLLLSFFFICPSSSPGQEYRDVLPEYRVKLPDDLYYRDDFRIQWWYFTGHLSTVSGRRFGYELTFFVVGVQKRKYVSRFGLNTVVISHFALSDISEGEYFFSDKADGVVFGFAGASRDRLGVFVGGDRLEGSMEEFHLAASAEDRAIDLSLIPGKPYVPNGEGGYSRKSESSPLQASLYFSNTDLRTAGTVKIADRVFEVTGKSWFDREISSRPGSEDLAGWDWFAIQLDDGRDIMLSLLRKSDGALDRFSSGTLVYRDGTYRILDKGDFSVRALDRYRSRKTGAWYPSAWEVGIPSENLSLRVTPLMQDQEFVAPYSTWNYYWEGACRVSGSTGGRAYVELTGYSEKK
jgi:predicted secreted hydrolase